MLILGTIKNKGRKFLKSQPIKKGVPNKNNHTIKTFTEATKMESKMSSNLCMRASPPNYLKKDKKH